MGPRFHGDDMSLIQLWRLAEGKLLILVFFDLR